MVVGNEGIARGAFTGVNDSCVHAWLSIDIWEMTCTCQEDLCNTGNYMESGTIPSGRPTAAEITTTTTTTTKAGNSNQLYCSSCERTDSEAPCSATVECPAGGVCELFFTDIGKFPMCFYYDGIEACNEVH